LTARSPAPPAAYPLIAGYRPRATLAFDAGAPVTHGGFLQLAEAAANALPPARFVVNLCESRGAFMIGFVGALLRGQTSLLPPSRNEAVVARLRAAHPGCGLITDETIAAAVDRKAPPAAGAPAQAAPTIAADAEAAIVFTSGTVGAPLPHARSWGSLVVHARMLSARMRLRGAHVLATVPPQHAYGLETTVMSALAGGAVVDWSRPFFPQDLSDTAALLPAPRYLFSTPVHLRALLDARPALPPLARVVSATAALPRQLALELERHWSAPVYEIYGSTESGAVASRRTIRGRLWSPLPGVEFEDEPTAQVWAPHLPCPVPLADILECEPGGRMRLLGRGGDMIKVVGKRMSLNELNHRLLSIDGVEDAIVFMPHEPLDEGIAAMRPAALVVAPTLSENQILDALARQVDPVFLPRPLRRVERLPRNELGKLPHSALHALLAA
jgi:acyl-coenzyme A synthetase/AMP-(fatty) acid ligase